MLRIYIQIKLIAKKKKRGTKEIKNKNVKKKRIDLFLLLIGKFNFCPIYVSIYNFIIFIFSGKFIGPKTQMIYKQTI